MAKRETFFMSHKELGLNSFGVILSEPNRNWDKIIPAMRGRGTTYNCSKGGQLVKDAVYRMYGMTGSSGIVRVTDRNWATRTLATPNGIQQRFEFECMGPVSIEVLGMTNAMIYAEFLEDL